MLKFCVSISWRVLSLFVEDGELVGFSTTQIKAAHEALMRWAEFLLGRAPHPGRYEQHFLPTGLIGKVSGTNLPLNLNRYLLRSVDVTPAVGKGGAIIYTKLERFILVGFIDIESPRQWVGTKLHVKTGKVGQGDFVLPSGFGDFLLSRCRMGEEIQDGMLEIQKSKIARTIEADKSRLLSSETLKTLDQDVQLFGYGVFKPDKT